jgi:SAM-dependent methyltransferase
MKAALKRIYAAVFGVSPTSALQPIYVALGSPTLGQRWFYYGKRRRLGNCLSAEAAPGTVEIVLSLLQGTPKTATVLDYGCGQGKGEHYQKLGYTISTCDILPVNAPNFTLITDPAGRLPYADNQFDVCIASEVIEHVESPFALLLELLRITKKQLIISTPNPASLHSRALFKKTGYLHWFTPNDFSYHCSPIFYWQLERFCKEHGARITDFRANHEAFGLKGNVQEFAETMILSIEKS